MAEFIAASPEVMAEFIATSPGEAAILLQLNNINCCLQDIVCRLSHIEETMKPVTTCLHHTAVSMQHLHRRVDRVDASLAGAVIEHAGGCGPIGVGWLQHLQNRMDRVDAAVAAPVVAHPCESVQNRMDRVDAAVAAPVVAHPCESVQNRMDRFDAAVAAPVGAHPCESVPVDAILHMHANGIGSDSYVTAQWQAHQDLICKVDTVIASLRLEETSGGDAQMINDFIDSCKELPSVSAGRSTNCAFGALEHFEDMVQRGIVWTTHDIQHVFKDIAEICMNLDILSTGRIKL